MLLNGDTAYEEAAEMNTKKLGYSALFFVCLVG